MAALALYDDGGPIWAALFAEPELLSVYRQELARRGFGPHATRAAIAEYVAEEQKIGRIARSTSAEGIAACLLGASFQRAFATHFLGTSRAVDEDRAFVRAVVATILEMA